jgi:hypothetical protein
MTTALQNLMEVDNNIDKIRQMVTTNEHNAAGIQLSLSVGANATKTVEMSFGISSDVEGLVEKILGCLYESKTYWTKEIKKDIREANDYLSIRVF